MIYIRRELERKFLQMSQAFKAVMVVGARQVGKSTMLKQLAKGEQRTYVTMDDIQLRQFAQSDPKLFLQTYKPPILIDEVQKAPELFERIKIICDESEEKGLFWLTGSQSKKLMKKAGDSLKAYEKGRRFPCRQALCFENVQSFTAGTSGCLSGRRDHILLSCLGFQKAAVPGKRCPGYIRADLERRHAGCADIKPGTDAGILQFVH